MWTLLSWGPEGWMDEIAYGVFVTVSLALATLPVGLFIGFLIALGKQSPERSLRLAADIYTTIFRGLPELLTLFLVFYGAQIGIQQVVRLFNPSAAIEVNSFVSGMIALGVVFSSYASEVFLSAFRAIPQGQYEGGYAIGLSKFQTMRLVVLPQLVRIALPGLANLWLILLKDTSLVSAIGLTDILRQSGVAARVTKQAFLFFGLATLIYLALAILSSIGIGLIERRVGKQEAQR
ncbi:polar amino acid transport system permease protein [Aquamicrobium terrae]|uniref:Polar amino acid transport system permease protein n=1 Tax=Aquamicrobium terrae TaxID=1324945 RepID=A0ABV2N0M4_9HYPH